LSGNIEIITRFEHAFRAADQATIDELCDPGLVDHNPALAVCPETSSKPGPRKEHHPGIVGRAELPVDGQARRTRPPRGPARLWARSFRALTRGRLAPGRPAHAR
jgi:hypothetical protein